MSSTRFTCDYAKRGVASCKRCKQKLEKGSLRLGKIVPNPFSDDGGDMKQWFHAKCLMESFERARPTTKKIEDTDDIEDFNDLKDEDKKLIEKLIDELGEKLKNKNTPKKAKKQTQLNVVTSPRKITAKSDDDDDDDKPGPSNSARAPPKPGSPNKTPIVLDDAADADTAAKDNLFRTYRKLCAEIAEESSYNGKTKIVSDFLNQGTSGDGFKGDVYLLMKLLLPGVVKRVYNLKDKQLGKLYTQMFGVPYDDVAEDLEQGDAAETARIFFEKSRKLQPSKKSDLSIQDVDAHLDKLAGLTREEEQLNVLTKLARQCTTNDFKMVIRLIKHDLRINTGAKHILEALDKNAYDAFQASRDLHDVVSRAINNKKSPKGAIKKQLSVRASLMTPVLPMLAEACRSVEQAMRKCPNGFYAEIKYDGERVQVHKNGSKFDYFSRSLKSVQPHKVQHLKDYIPKAFPGGNDLIIDSEVLLVDTNTGTPLPFGTLGKHKKQAFKDASVCLFVFDCLHLNGENLMNKGLKHRRKVLEDNMVEIKNHIMFSEKNHIKDPMDLKKLMTRVFNEGLEGLVLKDIESIYEPGKRHWLKVKKDYLAGGAMADTADLVVLGAYYGTGNKGGMMSVFLMGCYDPDSKKWCTVTKCGNGHDDKTLDRLQKELDMKKISKEFSAVPSWLKITRGLVPDFVVKDPKEAPVWEITGAEFSHSDNHTANGISIRFPRVTKIRDDKSWKEATDVKRLTELYRKSKERSDLEPEDMEASSSGRPAKRKQKDGDVAAAFRNGSNSTPPEKKVKISLTDIFTGMCFQLSSDLSKDEASKLRRHIIAYDGDVDDEPTAVATHRVEPTSPRSDSGHLPVVTATWVWRCIKSGRLIKE